MTKTVVQVVQGAILVIVGYYLGCWIDTLPPFNKETEDRSRMSIYVDNRTGCHYLGKLFGGLTPRLRPDGSHICGGD